MYQCYTTEQQYRLWKTIEDHNLKEAVMQLGYPSNDFTPATQVKSFEASLCLFLPHTTLKTPWTEGTSLDRHFTPHNPSLHTNQLQGGPFTVITLR